MRTSIRGRAALAASEGIVPAVYLDSVGVPTYGVGVTHWAVGEEAFSRFPVKMPADLDTAVDGILDLYSVVLPQYERAVLDAVKVPLTQYQFDALVHFAYNVGGPNFRKSKLLKWINAGDFDTAARRGFHGWLKPPELLSRRDLESAMFRGEYPTKRVPVYETDGNRKRRGIIRTYDQIEIVEMLKTPPNREPSPQFRVPQEMQEVAEDANKAPWQSKQVRTVILGWAASGYAWWNAADTETRVAITAIALALLFIFADRIRKSKLGRRGLAVIGL